jgi:hypothetical protein
LGIDDFVIDVVAEPNSALLSRLGLMALVRRHRIASNFRTPWIGFWNAMRSDRVRPYHRSQIGFLMSMSLCPLALCTALLLTFAPSALADADPKNIAKQICECLRKPHAKASEIIEQFKTAQHSGDFSKLMSMQENLEGEMTNTTKAAQKCFLKLGKKYPKVEADEAKREKVTQIAEKMCPNPVDQMMRGRP